MALSEELHSPKRSLPLWRTLARGSTNHRIFAAVITIASLTGVTRIAAVGKELVVAWTFGTGDALEAYLIAYLIPTLGVTVIANSFNAALIPTYIKVREHEDALSLTSIIAKRPLLFR